MALSGKRVGSFLQLLSFFLFLFVVHFLAHFFTNIPYELQKHQHTHGEVFHTNFSTMVNDLSLSEEDASMGTNSEQEDNSTTRNTASGEKEGEGSTSSSQGKIGKAETVAVNRSKVIVYVCLIIFSIAMSLATYVYVASEENSDFETAVRVFSPF